MNELLLDKDSATNDTENPFCSSDIGGRSLKSFKSNKLPKFVEECLDGFCEKIQKTKSFHDKFYINKNK